MKKITLTCVRRIGGSFDVDLTEDEWLPENGDTVGAQGFVGKVTHTFWNIDTKELTFTAKEE